MEKFFEIKFSCNLCMVQRSMRMQCMHLVSEDSLNHAREQKFMHSQQSQINGHLQTSACKLNIH